MFEEKKTKGGRSISLSVFGTIPTTVRAFIYLFLLMLIALFVFGYANRTGEIPAFDGITNVLTDGLKLVIGAVLGALSAEGAKYMKGKDTALPED